MTLFLDISLCCFDFPIRREFCVSAREFRYEYGLKIELSIMHETETRKVRHGNFPPAPSLKAMNACMNFTLFVQTFMSAKRHLWLLHNHNFPLFTLNLFLIQVFISCFPSFSSHFTPSSKGYQFTPVSLERCCKTFQFSVSGKKRKQEFAIAGEKLFSQKARKTL
jgi:hypothetical protein